VVRAPRIDVEYSLWDLLRGDIDVSHVAIREPVIHLRRTDEGVLNLAAAGMGGPAGSGTIGTTWAGDPVPAPAASAARHAPAPTSRAAGGPRGWSIGDIVIQDGTLTIGSRGVVSDAVNAPERLTNLDAVLSARSGPRRSGVSLGIESLSFQAHRPASQVQSASGVLLFSAATLRFEDLRLHTSAGVIALDGAVTNRRATPHYDVAVDLQQLSLDALAPIVPALAPHDLSPTVLAYLQGPANRLAAQFDIGTTAGQVSGEVTLDATAPDRAIVGHVQTTNLNLAALQPGATKTNLTLDANVDLKVPSGDFSEAQGTYRLQA
jgi:uncharacterized protein involved in outer membrane biogenesis